LVLMGSTKIYPVWARGPSSFTVVVMSPAVTEVMDGDEDQQDRCRHDKGQLRAARSRRATTGQASRAAMVVRDLY
jgi:hypothetical protein